MLSINHYTGCLKKVALLTQFLAKELLKIELKGYFFSGHPVHKQYF